MFEYEELEQILLYHTNSNLFPSRSIYYIGDDTYQQNRPKQYIRNNYTVSFNTDKHNKELFSNRKFTDKPMNKDELQKILTKSYFVANEQSYYTPSAGNLLPIEIYVIINNITGIKNGVYHYEKEKSLLNFIKNLEKINFLLKENSFALDANALIVLTASIEELTKKYRSRSYRHALIECGHIGQNFYLNAQKSSIGCCSIGGFYDQKVIDYLSLNKYELPLYIITLGK